MQSTGHSSMHALSSTSTHGSAITYVTYVLRKRSQRDGCAAVISMPLVLEPSWLGRRVTVRRAVDRDPGGRLRFADVVGDLVALDDQAAVVDTRHGRVEVPVELVAAAKLVPPSSADELAVEEVIARGWRAAETAHVGGWLLRAAGGFTGRANSVLPLRSPRLPLDEALAAVCGWYAERDLPAKFQVPVESRRLLDA